MAEPTTRRGAPDQRAQARDTASPMLDLYKGVRIPQESIGRIPEPGAEIGWRERGKLESNTPPALPGYVQCWAPVQWRNGEQIPTTALEMAREGWLPRPRSSNEIGAYQTASATDHTGASIEVFYMDGCILFMRTKELDDRARELMRARTRQKTGDTTRESRPNWNPRHGDTFDGLRSQTTVGRDGESLVDS